MLNNLLTILKNGKDKIIYQINTESITYYECYQRVLELSENLKKQGTSSVIIYGHKSINQFISILACVVAKRCYIPIDVWIPKNRIEEIIWLSHSTLVIKNEEVELSEIENLTVDELNQQYYDKVSKNTSDNKIAYIIFTSGSTGKSKGVPITYDNLNHFIEWITNLKEFKNLFDFRVLSQASFSFDLSVMDIYFSIYKNATIIAVDGKTKKDIGKLYHIIKKEKIHFLVMTPTFSKMLLLEESFQEENFPDIQYMFFCGECLEKTTAKKIQNRFSNITLINAYGPTEATCCVSLVEITASMLDQEYLPVGRLDTSAVKIEINNEEIVLKGKSVFNGYLGGINSQNCFQENHLNCYKTGDLGKIKDNLLYCNGRMDNQIKYQGYRIELGDIDNNLLKVIGVREAVAIAKHKEDSSVVKFIKAFVVVDENIHEQDIKKQLSLLVPSYMIPKKIVILDSMPVNTNGKYDRKKLEEL